MRTSVKHIAPVLAQYPYLCGADVAMQPHQVTGKRPEGQVSNRTITRPKTVPSFWQRAAYLR
ncbi:MAG: hypothetical protein AB8E82_08440 [Aureispira sp.]